MEKLATLSPHASSLVKVWLKTGDGGDNEKDGQTFLSVKKQIMAKVIIKTKTLVTK